jgi:hypothetical protein
VPWEYATNHPSVEPSAGEDAVWFRWPLRRGEDETFVVVVIPGGVSV